MTPPYAMPKTTAAAKKLQASRVKRYEKTIAAWRARPATRVRLAPKRSARRPEPIRPAIDESPETDRLDRKSTRLNSSHDQISYAVFCLKKKNNTHCRDNAYPWHRDCTLSPYTPSCVRTN